MIFLLHFSKMTRFEKTYNKQILLLSAISAQLKNTFSDLFDVIYSDSNYVHHVVFKDTPTQEQETQLDTIIDGYVDPPYFLTLAGTEENFFNSSLCVNSTTPFLIQTFIVTPTRKMYSEQLGNISTVLADMKVVSTIEIEDTNALQTWDSSNNPVEMTITIFDVTRNIDIKTCVFDVSDVVLDMKMNGGVDRWKTYQIYGLKDLIADYDCIWQFKIHINNPMVGVGLNSLQRLYYYVEECPTL